MSLGRYFHFLGQSYGFKAPLNEKKKVVFSGLAPNLGTDGPQDA